MDVFEFLPSWSVAIGFSGTFRHGKSSVVVDRLRKFGTRCRLCAKTYNLGYGIIPFEEFCAESGYFLAENDFFQLEAPVEGLGLYLGYIGAYNKFLKVRYSTEKCRRESL